MKAKANKHRIFQHREIHEFYLQINLNNSMFGCSSQTKIINLVFSFSDKEQMA